MTGTKAQPRKPQTVPLREEVRAFLAGPLAAGQSRVDREGGFIRDVRVLGLSSENNRRYTPEAARDAKSLYEGRKVKINHPLKPGEQRPIQSTFGWLEGIYEGPDGALFARKLHYLKTHEMAGPVTEAAERNPTLYSLSHNAEGHVRGRDADGKEVVDVIERVISVDLVDEGATNKSLFEGRTVKVKVSQILREKVLPALKAGRKKFLAKLLEEGGADSVEMESEEAGDHKGHLFNAMRACEESGDDEMAGKIHKLLKPGEKETEEEDDESGKGDGKKDDDGDKTDDGPVKEGKKAKAPAAPAVGLTEARAKALCKLAGIDPKAEVLEAVVGLDEAKAVSVLTLAKGQAPPRPGISAPRSTSPGARPVTEGKLPASAEDQAKSLLR